MNFTNAMRLATLSLVLAAMSATTLQAAPLAGAPQAADSPQKAEPGTAPTVSKAAVRTASYPGRAPYICSPSGFGERARCFLRSSLPHGGR